MKQAHAPRSKLVRYHAPSDLIFDVRWGFGDQGKLSLVNHGTHIYTAGSFRHASPGGWTV